MTPLPRTVADCDREIVEYMRALAVVSEFGRVAVWEQIDRILEIRYGLMTDQK